MPSMPLFHRVPSFDFEGVGVRRRQRRKRFVAFVAFVLALGAIVGVVLAWTIALGFGDVVQRGLELFAG